MNTLQNVICLHGYTEDQRAWNYLETSNFKDKKFFFPNVNAYFHSFETISSVAVEIHKEFKSHDNVVILGHSMGGYIALELLHKYPEWVKAISLVNSSPFADDENKKEQRQRTIRILESGEKGVYLKSTIPLMFADEFAKTHQDVIAAQIEIAMDIDDQILINQNKAMMHRQDHSALWKSSGIYKQWILGEKDNLIDYKKMAEFASQFDELMLNLDIQSGHMTYTENPSFFNNAMQSFLS